MEVNFEPIYTGKVTFAEANYPRLESYAEVYKTAIGETGDQPALKGGRIKEKQIRVIDLKEELCDLSKEILKTEFSLGEFEGYEGNINDDGFKTKSSKTNDEIADYKLQKSRRGCSKKWFTALVVTTVAVILLIPESTPFALLFALVYALALSICISLLSFANAGTRLYGIEFELKKKGYIDENGNAIDASKNPVKLKLEESLADLNEKLAEKELQIQEAEREFSESLSSMIQIVNQKANIQEKLNGSLFSATVLNKETVAQMTKNSEALEELEKAERFIRILQEKGVIPKQPSSLPEGVTAVARDLSQLVSKS